MHLRVKINWTCAWAHIPSLDKPRVCSYKWYWITTRFRAFQGRDEWPRAVNKNECVRISSRFSKQSVGCTYCTHAQLAVHGLMHKEKGAVSWWLVHWAERYQIIRLYAIIRHSQLRVHKEIECSLMYIRKGFPALRAESWEPGHVAGFLIGWGGIMTPPHPLGVWWVNELRVRRCLQISDRWC